MKNDNQNFSRRDFIKAGTAVAAIGVTSLPFSLKRIVAQSKQTGKPLLNLKTLNAALTPQGTSTEKINIVMARRHLAAGVRKDVPAWVRNNFTLTPNQDRLLNAMPEKTKKDLQGVLKIMEETGSAPSLNFTPTRPGSADALRCKGKASAEVNTGGAKASVEWEC